MPTAVRPRGPCRPWPTWLPRWRRACAAQSRLRNKPQLRATSVGGALLRWPRAAIFSRARSPDRTELPMNWLTNVVRPKIRNILRRETPENLWIKCPDTGQLVFYKDVESNQFVIPGSNYHMRMGAVARLKSIFDNEVWYD